MLHHAVWRVAVDCELQLPDVNVIRTLAFGILTLPFRRGREAIRSALWASG
jgi:hypothetical protein